MSNFIRPFSSANHYRRGWLLVAAACATASALGPLSDGNAPRKIDLPLLTGLGA
jgi:hypothetical protein